MPPGGGRRVGAGCSVSAPPAAASVCHDPHGKSDSEDCCRGLERTAHEDCGAPLFVTAAQAVHCDREQSHCGGKQSLPAFTKHGVPPFYFGTRPRKTIFPRRA